MDLWSISPPSAASGSRSPGSLITVSLRRGESASMLSAGGSGTKDSRDEASGTGTLSLWSILWAGRPFSPPSLSPPTLSSSPPSSTVEGPFKLRLDIRRILFITMTVRPPRRNSARRRASFQKVICALRRFTRKLANSPPTCSQKRRNVGSTRKRINPACDLATATGSRVVGQRWGRPVGF